MPANPINTGLLKLSRGGQGARPRCCSLDPARRAYYAASRTARYARYVANLTK